MVSIYRRRSGRWDAVGKINGHRRHFQAETYELAQQRYEFAKETEEYDSPVPIVLPDATPTPRLYREAGLDIEATNLKADFGVILCACVKPIGQPVITLRLDDYKDRQPWDDTPLVRDLCDVLNQCSRIYTWYGKRYDVPFIRSRKLLDDLQPPVTFSHVDLWEIVRKHFLLKNNRLDTFAKALADKEHQKSEIEWKFWARAMFGDVESMNYIVDHCEHDVSAMEQVYVQVDQYVRYWQQEVL